MFKISKKPKKQKPKVDEEFDSYKDYEPDVRDLAAYLRSEEEFMKENPNYDPEDHYISIQTDIALGK
jgi:hypothetical protein